jgi:hypothetical protein
MEHVDFDMSILDCIVAIQLGCTTTVLLILGKYALRKITPTLLIIHVMVGMGCILCITRLSLHPFLMYAYFAILWYAYDCLFIESVSVLYMWAMGIVRLDWKEFVMHVFTWALCCVQFVICLSVIRLKYGLY